MRDHDYGETPRERKHQEPKRLGDAEWLGHPHTAKMMAGLKQDWSLAYGRLMLLASESTDARVRAEHARLQTLNAMMETFEQGVLEEEKGEEPNDE